MKNIWRLINLIPEYRWKVGALIALSTLLGLTNIIVPYLFKNIIDQVAKLASPGHNISSISHQITYYLIILGLVRIAIIALGYLGNVFQI